VYGESQESNAGNGAVI